MNSKSTSYNELPRLPKFPIFSGTRSLPVYPLRGFTLVELLVVIGIIAVLIGIILPVLSRVQGRSRDLKCLSNLRSIGQMLLTYSSENKGAFPYGFAWLHYDQEGKQAPGNDNRYNSWASTITRMSRTGDTPDPGNQADQSYAPFLRCPQAETVGFQLVSYVANHVIMPSIRDESTAYDATGAPTPYQFIKPATPNRLYPDNILVHDTALIPESATLEAGQHVGFLVNVDVDRGRIWTEYPANTRYRPKTDSWGAVNPIYSINAPVLLDLPGQPNPQRWKNVDPAKMSGSSWAPYQGNVRFRHARETLCNVVFADGHAEGLAKKDMLRKYFLIKPHPNVQIDPSFPF